MVASLLDPPARLRGYLQRFLLEPQPGHFVGGGTREMCEDIRGALIEHSAHGFLVVSNFRSESGFEFTYFNVPGSTLEDVDGVKLIERN